MISGFELYSGALFNPMEMSFTKVAIFEGRELFWVQRLEQFTAACLQFVSTKSRKMMNEATSTLFEGTMRPGTPGGSGTCGGDDMEARFRSGNPERVSRLHWVAGFGQVTYVEVALDFELHVNRVMPGMTSNPSVAPRRHGCAGGRRGLALPAPSPQCPPLQPLTCRTASRTIIGLYLLSYDATTRARACKDSQVTLNWHRCRARKLQGHSIHFQVTLVPDGRHAPRLRAGGLAH